MQRRSGGPPTVAPTVASTFSLVLTLPQGGTASSSSITGTRPLKVSALHSSLPVFVPVKKRMSGPRSVVPRSAPCSPVSAALPLGPITGVNGAFAPTRPSLFYAVSWRCPHSTVCPRALSPLPWSLPTRSPIEGAVLGPRVVALHPSMYLT